jgi:ornithine carbamoyltransferase
MGEEGKKGDIREIFLPYQVNSSLLSLAKKEVGVMHFLPAHRGEEITEEVIEGEHSLVWDEAENRLYTAEAVLALFI